MNAPDVSATSFVGRTGAVAARVRAPTRLLVLFEATERGGAEDYVLRLAEGLPGHGWAVHAGFPDRPVLDGLAADIQAAGAVRHRLDLRSGTAAGPAGAARALAGDAVRTVRLLRRARPDVVLVNLPYPEAAPGVLLGCAAAGTPTAAVFHLVRPGIDISAPRRRLYEVARRRQRWFAVSSVAAAGVARVFAAPDLDVPTIPNGIARPLEPTFGSRSRVRAELALDDDEPMLLTVGRLSVQKGHATLLRAAAEVVRTHPRVRLVWAGDGEARVDLERAIAAAGLGHRVRLLGRRSDVADLLEAADGVVLPSHYEATPFFSLLEALAAGRPVITTDAGAPERLVPDVHALVVPTDDAPALASALRGLLDDPGHARRMADAGRVLVGTEYTAERMLDRTSALLATVIADRRT